ncbi:class GN sortase [Psychromonas sp. KJ10-10]|uniref:class GN sortase n=1 Tax=Psychromonas sp. KJ10-10 TaxID=3391823 RepID=UPI0039B3C368
MKTIDKVIPLFNKLLKKWLGLSFFLKFLLVYSVIALSVFGKGAYIKVKAQVAQVLLEVAWQKQQQDFLPHKAWSWADGYPLAKLTINQHKPLIILTGATGSNLAFAPSWLASSSLFTEGGNSVIFAHNDTHFKVLKNIDIGDKVSINTADQQHYQYQVSETKIINETNLSVLAQTGEEIVTLITCYPFDSSIVNSDLRFVVIAKRIITA